MIGREDFRSETWKRLEQELNDRLIELREINDMDRDEIKTAATRGQIAEVKRMLALRKERSAGTAAGPSESWRAHDAE